MPHPAGSERTKEIASYIEKNWKEQGLEDVVIHRYDVLHSEPVEVRVEMVAPERYVPTLREDVYEEDPDTAHPDVSGAWISFSASGEVTAPVVYANSGNPADYEFSGKTASIREEKSSSSAIRIPIATEDSKRSPPSVRAPLR